MMLQHQVTQDVVTLFGIEFDAISLQVAVQRIYNWIRHDDGNCRYVVTPNVDHLVQLRQSAEFRAAYQEAAMVVADGLPLVLASRLFRQPIPERVAGSDLVPALFAAASQQEPLRVFLLGAGPGVAERAAKRIETQWPAVRVVGVLSPDFGFENDASANQTILQQIQSQSPDILVVGLGAPKQELWMQAHRDQLSVKVALCAGATIDFLAGDKARAPHWMQKLGLEWCHRMLSDPKRLVRRYARDAWVFPQILWQQWRAK